MCTHSINCTRILSLMRFDTRRPITGSNALKATTDVSRRECPKARRESISHNLNNRNKTNCKPIKLQSSVQTTGKVQHQKQRMLFGCKVVTINQFAAFASVSLLHGSFKSLMSPRRLSCSLCGSHKKILNDIPVLMYF